MTARAARPAPCSPFIATDACLLPRLLCPQAVAALLACEAADGCHAALRLVEAAVASSDRCVLHLDARHLGADKGALQVQLAAFLAAAPTGVVVLRRIDQVGAQHVAVGSAGQARGTTWPGFAWRHERDACMAVQASLSAARASPCRRCRPSCCRCSSMRSASRARSSRAASPCPPPVSSCRAWEWQPRLGREVLWGCNEPLLNCQALDNSRSCSCCAQAPPSC